MREVWSGIDVGKQRFEASWVETDDRVEEFGRIAHRGFERSPSGVREYLDWLDRRAGQEPACVRAVMEATGRYSLELIVWLLSERPELEPALVHPKQARHFQQSLGLRNKTDGVDARALGLMGQQRRPAPYQPLEPDRQELRELIRQRRALVVVKVGEENRLGETPDSKTVRSVLQSHLRSLGKLIDRVEKAIRRTVDDSPALRRDVELLTSLPGVGWIVAVTVLGELGDLRRFRRSRQISAAAGLSPCNRQSGALTRPARIQRGGPGAVRAVLYLGALAACRHDNRMARVYHHLIDDNHLAKRQATVAVMRKMLVTMRAVLVHQSPYQDDFSSLHPIHHRGSGS